jgi:hypothetical protein
MLRDPKRTNMQELNNFPYVITDIKDEISTLCRNKEMYPEYVLRN